MVEIIPAIMSDSFEDLNEKYSRVKDFADIVQIDVMDGKFVPSISWPYIKNDIQTIDFDFEVDLMISNPESEVLDWVNAGAKRIIIHIESVNKIEDIFFKIPSNIEVGIALNTTTSNESIYHLVDKIDFVQFMGIEKIGFQAQPFDERVLDKIADLREKYSRFIISVDGSVNRETAPKLVRAGANRLAVGSALFDSDDIGVTIKELSNYK